VFPSTHGEKPRPTGTAEQAATVLDCSHSRPPALQERRSAGPRAAPMYLLERRPQPDVGNLLSIGACAFTGEPAGHTRMPPGLRNDRWPRML